MKSREWYIDAVKVKLEEVSPFEEPENFVADDDEQGDSLKPIISYIVKSLDEATRNCLRALPLSLLHADVERSMPQMHIGNDGVGRFDIQPNTRFIRFRHSEALERDITEFITSEDPLYLIMQDKDCRPKQCKTMAVVSSDMGQMEIYSYLDQWHNTDVTDAMLLSINLEKQVGVPTDFNPALSNAEAQSQLVQSPIEELIVLECARIVFNILKDYDGAKVCENDYQLKLQAML